jgi:hypothetical protein
MSQSPDGPGPFVDPPNPYASPASEIANAARPRARKFMKLGGEFSVVNERGEYRFAGPVVATGEAFFLKPNMSEGQMALAMVGGTTGGLIGGAIAGAIAHAVGGGKKPQSEFLCDLRDVPTELTRDRACPLGKTGLVYIIPRAEIEKVRYEWTGNRLRVITFPADFKIWFSLFAWGAVKFLRENGWKC